MSLPDNVYAFRRQPAAAVGSVPTRVPLWNLPSHCHCPVIGSCLGTDRLRESLDALFQARSDLCDFDLHVGVVRECGSRNKVSELLQQELDRLHADAIRELEGVESTAALGDAWVRAAGRGDIAGMCWAIVTHPCADIELIDHLLRELHMIQHRSMHAIGTQLEIGDRLAAENARLQAALADRTRECEQLRGALAASAAPARNPWRWRRFLAGASGSGSHAVPR